MFLANLNSNNVLNKAISSIHASVMYAMKTSQCHSYTWVNAHDYNRPPGPLQGFGFFFLLF